MSIRDRLEDALLLWENGRKQGAWIQVLIAAAATSRLRFPAMRDGDAFRALIREVTPTIVDSKAPAITGGVTVVFCDRTGGNGIGLDQLMYAHLRCHLVHEAVLASEVRLCESRVVDGQLKAELNGGDGTPHSPVTIPDFWVLHLAKAVANAPENVAACAGLIT